MKIRECVKIISILVLVLIGYYFLNRYLSISIPCVFYEITGLYCPGCGVTRMIFSLLQGNIYQSFRYNPFLFILMWSYLFYIFYQIVNRRKVKKINDKVMIVLLIITISFGILRNISIFSFLVPTEIH